MVEVIQRVSCTHCQSEAVVRNGQTRNGKHRFLCRGCARTFRENTQLNGYSEEEKARILRAYEERSSLRGLERTFGVSRQTVAKWLKKNDQIMLEQYGSGVQACQAYLLPAQEGDEVEVDEMWTWYGNKDQVIWLWIALCRRTRQVVAWSWGAHGQEWAQWLWDKVPQDYKTGRVYADAWDAYQGAIPPEQLHQQAKKGPTNHLERFNCTLRQRLGRLVRKTLSFSKCFYMHLVCLRRFFCRYNQEQAQRYIKSLPN